MHYIILSITIFAQVYHTQEHTRARVCNSNKDWFWYWWHIVYQSTVCWKRQSYYDMYTWAGWVCITLVRKNETDYTDNIAAAVETNCNMCETATYKHCMKVISITWPTLQVQKRNEFGCSILYTNQLFAGRDTHIVTCMPELGEYVLPWCVKMKQTIQTILMQQWKQIATCVRQQHIYIVWKWYK
jgi:hypothetical protein